MADKTFVPEFGPNGAVLNAPGVTPEFRHKLESEGSLKVFGAEFLLPSLVYAIVVVAFVLVAKWAVEQNVVSKNELWFLLNGFIMGVSTPILIRRAVAWAAPPVLADRQPPPRWFRISFGLVDVLGGAIISAMSVGVLWLYLVRGTGYWAGPVPIAPIWLLAIWGVHFLRFRMRKIAARREWALPPGI
jgi:hypothetical protein